MDSRKFWNRYSRYFNAEENTIFPPDTGEMEFYRKFRLRYPGDCLEIGAGSGRLARALLNRGATVALEPSDCMITSWNGSDRKLVCRVQGRGEQLPFRDGSFQFACFPYNGLQCILDATLRRKVVSEAFRVLLGGGALVIEVSPVFARRPEEALAERYSVQLPEGGCLKLEEMVTRCSSTGNVRYHMIYTETDRTDAEIREELVLELAALDLPEVTTALEGTGFTHIASYGDYDLSPYDPDTSPRLLTIARKGV